MRQNFPFGQPRKYSKCNINVSGFYILSLSFSPSLLFHNFETYCRRINHRSTRRILNPNISTVNSAGEETIGCSISRPFGFIQSHFPRLDCTLLSRLNSIEEEPSRYFRSPYTRSTLREWVASSGSQRFTTGEISGEHTRSTRSYRRGNVPRLGQHLLLTFSRWRENRVASTRCSPYFFVYRFEFFAI